MPLDQLVAEVQNICRSLAPHGWRELLGAHGFNVDAPNFAGELTRALNVDRGLPGFQDFAATAIRAIEPGKSSHSLLYHALASPNVLTRPNGQRLGAFPSLRDLEIVENCIYAARRWSIGDLRRAAGGRAMAIVVFAYEYRPACETVHRKYADMCFSRTGVARVGTQRMLYDKGLRGFVATSGGGQEFRVLPAKYAAYVAVERRGEAAQVGPLNFRARDDERRFWVPLHKLFTGPDCIRDLPIQVDLAPFHLNQKLRKVAEGLRRRNGSNGHVDPDLTIHPFKIVHGIAEISRNPAHCHGLLVPLEHPLTEPAMAAGEPLTFFVPPKSPTLFSALRFAGQGEVRFRPEFLHARLRILRNGKKRDLNVLRNVEQRVGVGRYHARYHFDWTADGWIRAVCPELALEFSRTVDAYSLVTAPDFFPNVSQRELLEWTQTLPPRFRDSIWKKKPLTLADDRMAANFELPNSDFRSRDKSTTAIVCMPRDRGVRRPDFIGVESSRHNHLPDGASGTFAPGWDISVGRKRNVKHLAAYGLGSPFPEDSKLCAALSAFWPAVSPDAARTFAPLGGFPTVSPLTDDEIGIGNPTTAWDGIEGPVPVHIDAAERIRRVEFAQANRIQYTDLPHGDYVKSALQDKFSLRLTSRIGSDEYQRRVLTMARLYEVLGVRGKTIDDILSAKAEWALASFQIRGLSRAERIEVENALGFPLNLNPPVYRFYIYRHGRRLRHPRNNQKVLVRIKERVIAFADQNQIVMNRNGGWILLHV